MPKQLYESANPAALTLWLAGLGLLLAGTLDFRRLVAGGEKTAGGADAGSVEAARDWTRFRPLAIAFLVTMLILLVLQGRSYYLAPTYPVLIAAGAAHLEMRIGRRDAAGQRSAWTTNWGLLGLGAVIGMLAAKPVVPVNSVLWAPVISLNGEFAEMVGWPDLVEQVAGVAASLSAEERAGMGILAGNYGEAGALALYGGAYGLPQPISGGNSLWSRGYGTPAPTTVILVGFDSSYAASLFASCRPAGRVTNRTNVKNEETTRHNFLYVCKEPRKPWQELWPEMQWFQ